MNPVVHVLTLVLAAGTAPSEPIDLGRYGTATECEMLARSVRVHQAGARLTCVRTPMTPQERQAWALLVGGRATASSPWWAAGPAAQRRLGSPLGANWVEVLP